MNRERQKLIFVIKLTTIAICILAILFSFSFCCSQHPNQHYFNDSKFLLSHQKDLPLLNTPQKVWEAENGKTVTFYFDGTYYTIKNLPKEYIKYSAEYVRMP